MQNDDLPKLLRAMASGTLAKESGQDVILNTAADELESWREKDSLADRAAREAAFGRYRN